MTITGILFDKDGTLFDFGATWNGWAQGVIAELSGGDAARAAALAEAVRFDLGAGRYHADSPVIAGTNREVAALLHTVLTGRGLHEIEQFLSERAAQAHLVPPVPLRPLLETLGARGLRLGVMTNDSEFSARAQLLAAGVQDRFSFVAGFDSGHGQKPDPDPLLAFAAQHGLAPDQVVMVGDSTHDLVAARAAGMVAVAVLTGMASSADLAPFADTVLPHIGHLPDWLDARA